MRCTIGPSERGGGRKRPMEFGGKEEKRLGRWTARLETTVQLFGGGASRCLMEPFLSRIFSARGEFGRTTPRASGSIAVFPRQNAQSSAQGNGKMDTGFIADKWRQIQYERCTTGFDCSLGFTFVVPIRIIRLYL